MDPQVSAGAFDLFFFWAPITIGIIIYLTFYLAKRREQRARSVPISQSYACATCGRRESREHMVPGEGGGSVHWYCSRCAAR